MYHSSADSDDIVEGKLYKLKIKIPTTPKDTTPKLERGNGWNPILYSCFIRLIRQPIDIFWYQEDTALQEGQLFRYIVCISVIDSQSFHSHQYYKVELPGHPIDASVELV